MSTELTTTHPLQAAIPLVTDSVNSPSTKDFYGRALREFAQWIGDRRVNRVTVNQYKSELLEKGLAASTINGKLSAIRRLALEAKFMGWLHPEEWRAIKEVENVKQSGIREGVWLNWQQVTELLNAPDGNTLKGLRDRAVLAVLVGAGLRRSECASLQFKHLRQVEGCWAIVDIVGKGNKVRSVPNIDRVKEYIDEWAEAAGISEGFVFRPVRRGGHLSGESLTSQAIYNVVKEYSDVAPHDLRRTFGKLSRKEGSDLEQIQKSLGHKHLNTTEIYLGTDQDFVDSPSSRIGRRL
jgi:integrase/recombinase XerD